MSLKTPKVVHYKSLHDSDIKCVDSCCGMMAQTVFEGLKQDWYLCNGHAAEMLAYWKDIDLVDDSEGTA